MSVKNLLYGLLVKSGNDAANVLAEAVSQDIDTFVDMMNQKVKEIGCTNTHFSNAHGFHDDEHYTTAYDMAKILRYCMKNETFREFVETKKITISETNKTNEKRVLVNTNKMFNENYEDMYYEYALGGKTGYTDEARGTFVGYLKKDDKTIIISAFDGSQNISGNEARFLDTIKAAEYIFDNFSNYTVISKDDIKIEFIDKNNKKKITLGLKEDIKSLSDNTVFRTSYSVQLNNVDHNKLYESSGKLNVFSKNLDTNFLLQNEYDLYITSIEDYNYFNLKENLRKITIILLIILLFLIVLNKSVGKNTKKRIANKKYQNKSLRKINKY